jgi:hypothetical protein
LTALQMITTTPGVARLQAEWIAKQAFGFWRESQWPSKSALSRERHRKKFLAYAREAIELLGVDAVAGHSLDRDWQAIIREIGREFTVAPEP